MHSLALKEWSSLCALLASGKIIGILRKGGLLDEPGALDQQTDFWLHPTHFHEKQSPLRTGWTPPHSSWLEEWPHRPGFVPLPAWCQVTGTYRILSLETALAWAEQSPYTEEMVRTRFFYREPGIQLHTLRVFPVQPVPWVEDLPAWAGCKSFHEVSLTPPSHRGQPVLDDEAYRRAVLRIEEVLKPIGYA